MDFPADLTTWTPWIDCASVIAVVYGVAKLFDWFDGLISDESRVALWLYMADLPTDERIDSWGSVFPKLIDRVFGERALSWKFFLRSCLASLLTVLTVAMIFSRTAAFASLGHEHFEMVRQGHLVPVQFSLTLLLTSSFFSALATNLIPDYLSLLFSRMIVRIIAKKATAFRTMILLVVDSVLTVALMLSVLVGYSTALNPLGTRETLHVRLYEDILPIFTLHSLLGIVFYAALLTSTWVWLYVLSILFIKIAHKFRRLWLKLLPYLDIEKKPMQAIGRIAGIMAGAGYALILGIVWLVHRGH